MKQYNQPYTIPGVMIKREEDDLIITLETEKASRCRLHIGSKPDMKAIGRAVAGSEDGSFRVNLPVEKGPYYFMIQADGFRTNLFSERVLQLKEAINVRDLGGYETNDGKFVKWGLLYRGDQLSKLDPEDIAVLEKHEVKSIVDYRSAHECTINPNKQINTVKHTF